MKNQQFEKYNPNLRRNLIVLIAIVIFAGLSVNAQFVKNEGRNFSSSAAEAPAAPATRTVRVISQNTAAGSTITVSLNADTLGDESIYGFSLNYNTSILTYVPNSIMIGSGATRQAGGMCSVLANTNTAGQFGFSIDCNNSTITAGANRELVTLMFTVASNAPTGSTQLTFGDTPTRRSVASNPAAGPITSLPTTFTDGAVNIGSARTVRVLSQNSSRNSAITVVIEADAMGDESIYGFSLNYDQSILTYVTNSAMIGSGAVNSAGGMCNLLANTNTAGQFGFSIDCNGNLAAGSNRRFVTLQFTVASNAPSGMTPLQFGNTPTRESVASNPSDGPIQSRPTVFTDGFVNIAAPTAAGVSVSGRILTTDGRGLSNAIVVLTNTNGVQRQVRSSSFGYYRFGDVNAGEDYVLSISSKQYLFVPLIMNVFDNLADVNVTATSLARDQRKN